MTWIDLKRNVLQMGDIISGHDIKKNNEVNEWVENMPRLCNHALGELRTIVKPIWSETPIVINSGDIVDGMFDMRAADADFYQIDNSNVILTSDGKSEKYNNYDIVAERYFKPRQGGAEQYTIWYYVYPGEIKKDTPDDYVLRVEPEAYILLELYICGQLLVTKDEENGAVRLQEYEEKKKEMRENYKNRQRRPMFRVV